MIYISPARPIDWYTGPKPKTSFVVSWNTPVSYVDSVSVRMAVAYYTPPSKVNLIVSPVIIIVRCSNPCVRSIGNARCWAPNVGT